MTTLQFAVDLRNNLHVIHVAFYFSYEDINSGQQFIVAFRAGAADADFPSVTIQPGLSGLIE